MGDGKREIALCITVLPSNGRVYIIGFEPIFTVMNRGYSRVCSRVTLVHALEL